MTVTLASFLARGTVRRAAIGLSIVVAAAAGGCANDSTGGFFATGALGDAPPVAAVKPAADPVCVGLSGQIETLRKDGTVERLEKAADGKSKDVNVQRAALAKQTQLNKLNADFIAKCGPNLPKPSVSASVATPVQPAAPATAAKPIAAAKAAATKAATAAAAPAATTVAAKDSGVTIAPPTAVQQ